VFGVVIASGDAPALREESIASVLAQTYPRWHLIGEQSEGASPREPVDYVLWVRTGDRLEPHALHRLARAVLTTGADILYSDEIVGSGDARTIHIRPAFSYDSLLCHDSLGSLVAIRASLLEQTEPGARPAARPGLDLLLRLLERAKGVTHVADVLYRRVLRDDPHPDPVADSTAVSRHLLRRGIAAQVRTLPGARREVTFPVTAGTKVAIVIPTKDRLDLLRRCLESLEATVPGPLADVLLIDHDTRDADARAYLSSLRGRHRVFPYRGPFNFSVMNNLALADVARRGGYSHYLLLNNDTEAIAPGWLERLLGHACRPEVGLVAPLLVYPDGLVQHAGVTIGLHYCAGNRRRALSAVRTADGTCWHRAESFLAATHDQQAVTGACLLVRASVYWQLGGLDESLAVGYGDVDFGLRAHAAGYKVLLDGGAVVIHHESATRGLDGKQHPEDTILFRRRYHRLIFSWDLYSHPLQARDREGELARDTRAPFEAPLRHVPLLFPGRAPS
jgi:GT2 family glycosyltransferase